MRHFGQIRDDRPTGNVFTHRDGEFGMHVVIHGRAENFREPHDFTFWIRNFEAHVRGAGNGLNDTNRYHRQCPRKIAGKIDNLRAFHTDGRLDLVTGDDRTRMRGDYFREHIEIHQFPLNQARGEFQRVVGRALDAFVRWVEQRNRRQRRIRQVRKQRRLFFLFHAV